MALEKFKNIANSVEELVGETPLLRLQRATQGVPVGAWLKEKWQKNNGNLAQNFNLTGEVLAKVEFLNPGGSVKDRIAVYIIDEAEKKGLIKPGATIVEATSGNTGAGLAMVAARRGYKCILVMPDKMSAEKINALRAYGAKVIVTPTAVGHDDERNYCNVAERLSKEIPGGFLANQYENPDNPQAHFLSTGPEIWEQTEGKITHFFCGLGTGGTMSGIARYLKSKNSDIKIIGIDPVGSIYYDLFTKGVTPEGKSYFVEGIGKDTLPDTLDIKLLDDCVFVNDEESFSATRMLAQCEGLLVGGSCGSAYFGAVQYLAYLESKSLKNYKAVVLLPDSGSRYLSKVFNEPWLSKNSLKTSWNDLRMGAEVEYIDGSKKIDGV